MFDLLAKLCMTKIKKNIGTACLAACYACFVDDFYVPLLALLMVESVQFSAISIHHTGYVAFLLTQLVHK